MKQTLLIPRDIAEWIEYCKSCSITLYGALELLKKHSRQAYGKLTEKMIKDSPLSWAWQFAKELEL